MKSLEPLEYDWLCAVNREDSQAVHDIAELLYQSHGHSVLLKRGLYTCQDDPDDVRFAVKGSIRLTSAGQDALMCYRALKGEFSFT